MLCGARHIHGYGLSHGYGEYLITFYGRAIRSLDLYRMAAHSNLSTMKLPVTRERWLVTDHGPIVLPEVYFNTLLSIFMGMNQDSLFDDSRP